MLFLIFFLKKKHRFEGHDGIGAPCGFPNEHLGTRQERRCTSWGNSHLMGALDEDGGKPANKSENSKFTGIEK